LQALYLDSCGLGRWSLIALADALDSGALPQLTIVEVGDNPGAEELRTDPHGERFCAVLGIARSHRALAPRRPRPAGHFYTTWHVDAAHEGQHGLWSAWGAPQAATVLPHRRQVGLQGPRGADVRARASGYGYDESDGTVRFWSKVATYLIDVALEALVAGCVVAAMFASERFRNKSGWLLFLMVVLIICRGALGLASAPGHTLY
jgi:hypothetical protein